MASTGFISSASLPHLLRARSSLRSYLSICAIEELNAQMLNVAISWHVYSVSHSALSLALVGLARFVPNICMMLVAGQAADRFDKRRLIGLSLCLQAACSAMFCLLSATGRLSVGPVYALLLVVSAAQALSFPASSALLPELVDAEDFPRAVAIASSAHQICALAGPAIGGLIYAMSGPGTFAASTALYLAAITQIHRLSPTQDKAAKTKAPTLDESSLGGFRYVRSNRLLLSLISLDLFAVLLGGITALLPIYAKDILAVGPAGLGCLRCAPGIGAAVVGAVLTHRPSQRGAGRLMLTCVAGFGFATIVFAVSTHFWLSLIALIAVGGFDMVSMVIRQTLVQVSTPEAMRGRVSAVQGVFIGASSELGEFESGITAAWFGAVPAAVLGGLGTLAVVALWTKMFPELRCADSAVESPATGD